MSGGSHADHPAAAGAVFIKLDAVQLRIEPAGRQQFGVGATLGQAMLLHDKDHVGTHDRLQVVGDHDRRLALHQAVERLDDGLLGKRVQI